MKTKINKKQGFHEDVDPLFGKARKHSIVAQKTKFDKEQVSDAVEIVPSIEEFLTLRFDDSEEFLGLVEHFEDANDTELQIDYEGDDVIIKVPADEADKFVEFLAEKGIKAKEELALDDANAESLVQSSEEHKEPETNVETEESEKQQVDEIIAEVQRERSKRAVSKDKSRTAKKVGRKENARDLIAWVKNPGKSDLELVDTIEAE